MSAVTSPTPFGLFSGLCDFSFSTPLPPPSTPPLEREVPIARLRRNKLKRREGFSLPKAAQVHRHKKPRFLEVCSLRCLVNCSTTFHFWWDQPVFLFAEVCARLAGRGAGWGGCERNRHSVILRVIQERQFSEHENITISELISFKKKSPKYLSHSLVHSTKIFVERIKYSV